MKLFYLRDKHRNPVACVVSEILTPKYVAFAVSTHNPIDLFDRSEARNVAVQRLIEGDVTIIKHQLGVKEKIVQAIADDKEFPTRTRVAAKLWLDNRVPVTNRSFTIVNMEHKTPPFLGFKDFIDVVDLVMDRA